MAELLRNHLDNAVEGLYATDPESLDDESFLLALIAIQRQVNRLTAFRSACLQELDARKIRAKEQGPP